MFEPDGNIDKAFVLHGCSLVNIVATVALYMSVISMKIRTLSLFYVGQLER